MQGCFVWLMLLAGGVFVILTAIRWFEQTAEAVDNGWWNKTALLVLMPFAVWFFPSRVSAGRPTMVPRHQPVEGFGMPVKAKPVSPRPPGPDPAQVEKLRQKMREQGMLGGDNDDDEGVSKE